MRALLLTICITSISLTAMAQSSSVRVTREPVVDEAVVFVLDYDEAFGDIDLQPSDIVLWSMLVPQITQVDIPSIATSNSSMEKMVSQNDLFPADPQKTQEHLPNTTRTGERLKHDVMPIADLSGNIRILNPGGNQRMVFVSELEGEGVLGLIVKGGTAQNGELIAAHHLVQPTVPVGVSLTTSDAYDSYRIRPLDNFSQETRDLLSSAQEDTAATEVRVIAQRINIAPATQEEIETYQDSMYWRGGDPLSIESTPMAANAPASDVVSSVLPPVEPIADASHDVSTETTVATENNSKKKDPKPARASLEGRILELEEELHQRNDTLAQLVREYLALKKRVEELESIIQTQE